MSERAQTPGFVGKAKRIGLDVLAASSAAFCVTPFMATIDRGAFVKY